MDSSFERSAALVKEWLRFHGYTSALLDMDRPPTICSSDLLSSDNGPESWRRAIIDRMIELLMAGEREKFWAQWGANIPGAVLEKDMEIESLWLNILAYFACRPMPHMNAPDVDGVQNLQTFLHSRSISLGGQPDYMLYCALPFIPRPDLSPQFKHIYSAEWFSSLKEKLSSTLLRVVRQPNWPRIYSLMSPSNDSARPSDQRMLADAAALDGSVTEAFEADLGSEVKSLGLPLAGVPLWPLDFGKVKRTLTSGEAGETSLVLQALRWRLVRCGNVGRAAVLDEYIYHDVLALGQGRGVVERLLAGHDREQKRSKEECARLLSCMANMAGGRSYLLMLGPEWVVTTLFTAMKAETGDNRLRQHLLGCLQKCSLRRAVQDHAITVGAVEWALAMLQDSDALSSYTVEYATALLLNLTLRTAGKDRCEPSKAHALEALIDLLEYDNPQVKQYVHGSLYSILTRGVLKERAKSMGLGEMMEALADVYRSQTNTPLAAQIDCISELLSVEPPLSDVSDTEDEPDHFPHNPPSNKLHVTVDDVFAEGPEDPYDILPATAGAPSLRGSELLYAKYCPPSSRVPRQTFPRNNEVEESFDHNVSVQSRHQQSIHATPMRRPTTPGDAMQQTEYRSPSLAGESHMQQGGTHYDGDFSRHHGASVHLTDQQESYDPSSPERINSSVLDNSFATPGPRRVQTPRQERLDAVRQKAGGQEVSVEEMKVVFGGQSRLARTPPRN